MSWKKYKKATLNGILPQFPESIYRLNYFYERLDLPYNSYMEDVFELGGKKFKEFKVERNAKTDDGYTWFSVVALPVIPAGEIKIAFPYFIPYDVAENDRSIAFYYKGMISQDYLGNLCLKLIELFIKYRDYEK